MRENELKTVKDLRELTGVTRKQLYEFDKADLLKPTKLQNEAGYKLYDDEAIDKLWQILIFVEIDTPLKEIRRILNGNSYNRGRVIEHQIDELKKKKARIEEMIHIAEIMQLAGTNEPTLNKFVVQRKTRIAQQLSEWEGSEEYKELKKKFEDISSDFYERLEILIDDLASLKGAESENEKMVTSLVAIEKLAREHDFGRPILWTITISLMGKGELYTDFSETYDEDTVQFISEWLSELMVISLQSVINDYTSEFGIERLSKPKYEVCQQYIDGLIESFKKIIPNLSDIDFYDFCKVAFPKCFEPPFVKVAMDALEVYYNGKDKKCSGGA